MFVKDTIVAIATPPGKGGVGVIRASGPQAKRLGEILTGQTLLERQAHYAKFRDNQGDVIDTGLAIYFENPRSFTGEDVVEFHGHGGPVIQDLILRELISLGARQARAGEFSERAFLNDKIDLAQAEAIADLIDSTTTEAARGAVRSMQGVFSAKVNELLQELIELRVYVEAAIDFPEEEIDFLADEKLRRRLDQLLSNLDATLNQAGQGAILRDGLTLVLAGKPNAGKSSLLNALAGEQTAIVTDVPGTTRDTIRQTISLDGLPVHIIDTAGLRDTEDVVEKIGVKRAREAIKAADHILVILDATDPQPPELEAENYTLIYNKVDLIDEPNQAQLALRNPTDNFLFISAKTGQGMDLLVSHLKSLAGFQSGEESTFTARRRHLTALKNTHHSVQEGIAQLTISNAGELLADELRQAQNHLAEITGQFSADDLLGEIFAGFCIGK